MSIRNTEGPWTAVEHTATDRWQIQYGSRGNWLAEVLIDGDEVAAEADARLIAAAPALLEAAKYAVERFGMWQAPTARMEAALEGLKAAIAKATEQSA